NGGRRPHVVFCFAYPVHRARHFDLDIGQARLRPERRHVRRGPAGQPRNTWGQTPPSAPCTKPKMRNSAAERRNAVQPTAKLWVSDSLISPSPGGATLTC